MMHIVTRLKIVTVLLFVNCLNSTSLLMTAATVTAAPESPYRSVVMSWSRTEVQKVWDSLNESQREEATTLVRGKTSPLRIFPVDVFGIVVTYIDERSQTYFVSKDILIKTSPAGPLKDQLLHSPKPLCGLTQKKGAVVTNGPGTPIQRMGFDFYACFDTDSPQKKIRLLFYIKEDGELSVYQNRSLRDIPERKYGAPVTMSQALYNVAIRGIRKSTQEAWDAQKSIDCRIGLDEKTGERNFLEWNVYDTKNIPTICALHHLIFTN